MGLVAPWSNAPHFMLPYDDNMSFKERTHNAVLTIYDLFYRNFYYLPQMQSMVNKHFANISNEPLPTIQELEKKVSLILVNSHRGTDSPRPTISGLVNVGGAHIKKPKPLPEDVRKFIESAENGVIYFSLGAFMKSADMPKAKLEIIIKALSQLKQKVLWKYEDESLTNIPKNIMIRKWMPQNDILAHKNVVLFITHGGRFGTLEGTYWGKPMLAIPLFGDQHTNVQRLKRQGIALSLDFLTFKSEELVSKVNTLLSKESVDRSKTISTLFQDNPIHPMDEAMYWIEYVIRHKGANHLKSKAINLNVFEHLLLDVFFIHLAFVVFAVVFLYSILSKVFGLYFV
uniref:UDP-glucuronosyltransferase n=1 Tax=Megaselia scalaris TaxID=36166 RepID=T1GVP2_MEGSC